MSSPAAVLVSNGAISPHAPPSSTPLRAPTPLPLEPSSGRHPTSAASPNLPRSFPDTHDQDEDLALTALIRGADPISGGGGPSLDVVHVGTYTPPVFGESGKGRRRCQPILVAA
uniref:Uncharacterized protein n=1 Tax=Zea mays TaxID=4577 RepID=A0A804RGP0_MAIZE